MMTNWQLIKYWWFTKRHPLGTRVKVRHEKDARWYTGRITHHDIEVDRYVSLIQFDTENRFCWSCGGIDPKRMSDYLYPGGPFTIRRLPKLTTLEGRIQAYIDKERAYV